jgi:hypothetical protein
MSDKKKTNKLYKCDRGLRAHDVRVIRRPPWPFHVDGQTRRDSSANAGDQLTDEHLAADGILRLRAREGVLPPADEVQGPAQNGDTCARAHGVLEQVHVEEPGALPTAGRRRRMSRRVITMMRTRTMGERSSQAAADGGDDDDDDGHDHDNNQKR